MIRLSPGFIAGLMMILGFTGGSWMFGSAAAVALYFAESRGMAVVFGSAAVLMAVLHLVTCILGRREVRRLVEDKAYRESEIPHTAQERPWIP